MARTQAKPLQSDKRYKDAPRYEAIYGYEDLYKKGFRSDVSKPLYQSISTLLGGFAKKL